jgi:cupredoxin-like protein
MRNVRTVTSLLAMTLTLSGCALFGIDTGYRSLTIRNHQLEPAVVNVPAGKQFMLTVDGVDEADLAITAADLGIIHLRVPATLEDDSPLTLTQIDPARRARLPLGPLKEGRYTVSCACHGHPSTAVIVAR